MTDLDELLRQRAELDARIEQVKAEALEGLRVQFAELATKLRAVDALPRPLVDLFTDKAGTFNAYRVMRVRKAEG